MKLYLWYSLFEKYKQKPQKISFIMNQRENFESVTTYTADQMKWKLAPSYTSGNTEKWIRSIVKSTCILSIYSKTTHQFTF
jgi:hypothetical protein